MYEKTHDEGIAAASKALRRHETSKLPSEAYFISFYTGQLKTDRDTRGVEMLPIGEALKYQLSTPAVTKSVYVAHPTQPWKLYSFADYENAIAGEKLNEALRILLSLGASEVITYSFRGSATDAEAKAGYSGFGANIKFSNAEGWKAKVSYQGEGSAPVDPRPLAFPDEPGFDAVCDAVIKNGATEFQLEIVSGRTFSLEGGLATPLKSAGFDLTASGQRAQASHFVVQAYFPMRGALGSTDS